MNKLNKMHKLNKMNKLNKKSILNCIAYALTLYVVKIGSHYAIQILNWFV